MSSEGCSYITERCLFWEVCLAHATTQVPALLLKVSPGGRNTGHSRLQGAA